MGSPFLEEDLMECKLLNKAFIIIFLNFELNLVLLFKMIVESLRLVFIGALRVLHNTMVSLTPILQHEMDFLLVELCGLYFIECKKSIL